MPSSWKSSAWPVRILAVLLALLATPATTSATRADDDAERARSEVLAGRILPLAQILSVLHSRYPGEVLDVDLEYDGGTPHYEIRLLRANGHILEARIDARTGRVLEVDEDEDD